MAEIEIVDRFRQIKEEAGCDDSVAAMLTLAEAMKFLSVSVHFDPDGNVDAVGRRIADAIEAVTKDGEIQMNVGGELYSDVRAMIGGEIGSSATKAPAAKKKIKRRS